MDEGPGCGSLGDSLLSVASVFTSALGFLLRSDSSLTHIGVQLELELDLAIAAEEVDATLFSDKASWFISFFVGTGGAFSWDDSFCNGLFLPETLGVEVELLTVLSLEVAVAAGKASSSSLVEEVEVADAAGTRLVTVTVCLITLPGFNL